MANGDGEVVYLDEVVRGNEHHDDDDDAEEAAMQLRWEIVRETSRRLSGEDWRDEGGPWGRRRFASIAEEIAIRSVSERRDLAEEIRRLQQSDQDALFLRSLAVPRRVTSEEKVRWQREGF
jgi:hypothetical protein